MNKIIINISHIASCCLIVVFIISNNMKNVGFFLVMVPVFTLMFLSYCQGIFHNKENHKIKIFLMRTIEFILICFISLFVIAMGFSYAEWFLTLLSTGIIMASSYWEGLIDNE